MLRIFQFNVHTIERERKKDYIITNSARNDSMRVGTLIKFRT